MNPVPLFTMKHICDDVKFNSTIACVILLNWYLVLLKEEISNWNVKSFNLSDIIDNENLL